MTTKPFDAIQTPLETGINLIEAAAGTGKTYTIAMLVLRFVVEQNVDIKQLLVVTFTKAATEELKQRIRSRLAEARQAIKYPEGKIDATLKNWLNNLTLEPELVRTRVEAALLEIDQAAIFTIHGFCQRILTEHALESGQLFDCELSGDITLLRQNCADDFWRRQLYQRPLWQVALLTSVFTSPDSLLASIGYVGLQQTVYPAASNLDAALADIQNYKSQAVAVYADNLAKLEAVFADGFFNDSYINSVRDKQGALQRWLTEPDAQWVDCDWLTQAGLLAGLNGRKFMVSKAKPSPGEQQKQDYLQSLALDCSIFDQLHGSIRQLQVIFRRALLQTLQTELEKAMQQKNVLSFDDLIVRLYQALTATDNQALCHELQQRFQVGLIDEFQDTDHKQWQIFSKVFAAEHQYLYLIGDPKQAIYKFRGADIYSYFEAQKQADKRHTLLNNWRSHPALVAAVNCLFQRDQPFLMKQLAFNPVNAGRTEQDGGIAQGAPLVLWQLDKNVGNYDYWTAGIAANSIRAAVVQEILQLLKEGQILQTGQAPRIIQPKDIAILVRSNAHAVEYQQALNAVNIPAVLNNKQSVFASTQAMELHHVLQAIAQPGDMAMVKQALTVSWFNLNGQQLYQLFNDDNALENWSSRFQGYYKLWQQQGLLGMMQAFLHQEQVEVLLGSQPQAERILTNLQHLIERLQQAAIEEHLAVNKTLDWLRQAIRQAEQDGREDCMLRLESDEDTVKIVTLHSSKGLEYPLVFCPNLWQRNDRLKSEQNLVQCHEQGEMVADIGSADFGKRREQAIQEELAEDLRLFYVAVTRARYRCYLAWADVRTKDRANSSAMAYLLEFAGDNFAAQQQKFADLVKNQPENFQYQLIFPGILVTDNYQPYTQPTVLECLQRQRSLQTRWQMSSYTALSSLSLHDVPELPEDKAVELSDELDVETEQSAAYLDLPKGAQVGNLIHSLLETADFSYLAACHDIADSRDKAIQRYGLHLENPATVDQLLHTIVTTPLDADAGFCLQDIGKERCLREMPFYLSMGTFNVAAINTALASVPAFQPLSAKQMCGYLTGFIDLICEYQGKYYVMDYKTNSLPDYRPETLLRAMRQHNYGLQYCLYTLVLDSYLQQRLPDYQYDLHFGGVKYLFVRGMRADIPGSGVFTDRPDARLITNLARIFLGGK